MLLTVLNSIGSWYERLIYVCIIINWVAFFYNYATLQLLIRIEDNFYPRCSMGSSRFGALESSWKDINASPISIDVLIWWTSTNIDFLSSSRALHLVRLSFLLNLKKILQKNMPLLYFLVIATKGYIQSVIHINIHSTYQYNSSAKQAFWF